jgi:phosphoribosylformylglycinamidine cyclo-ligase
MATLENKPLTYKEAGVDIDEGARLVDLIKPFAKATARPGSDAGLGGFAAAFDLKAAGFKDPLILTTTDGVGTKLKVSIEAGRPERIGIDLVAMCVNDLIANGAEPLVFLDYFATAKLDAAAAAIVIKGVAEGCRQAGCALAGGETAEMPGLYALGDYDLAGFSVGAAERGALLPRLDAIEAGDALIGVASSGPHSNGYALIRAIVARRGLPWDGPAPWAPGRTLADALLEPTRIYAAAVRAALAAGGVTAMAHITGGGLTGNIPRVVPDGCRAVVRRAAWRIPPIFETLREAGRVADAEMLKTFNLGVGYVVIARPTEADRVRDALEGAGETVWPLGEVVAGARGVELV